MRKNLFFLSLLLNITVGFAQMSIVLDNPVYLKTETPTFNSISLPAFASKELAIQYLEKNYLQSDIPGQTLVEDYSIESPVGVHSRYKHVLNGLPIFQSHIQINTDKQGKIYSIINSLSKIEPVSQSILPDNAELWINTNKGLRRAISKLEWDQEIKQPIHRIYGMDNAIIHAYHSRLFFTKPDSMISGMVYLPNPIVVTNNNYGGKYVDNNDKNSQELADARERVRFPMFFNNGKFIFKQGFITLKDIHTPNILPVAPTDTFLNYTRDQSGFEDVNVYYHLYNYSEYVKRTGFSTLLDSIYVDTHGEGGEDNSFFDPARYPYILEFGTGNVDDAEDAQVVIHEFGHSLSTLAAPGTARGHERLSMEEGQADYVAMSYSQSLNKNKHHKVFSWDGHNEFWDGFVTNTDRKYKKLTGILDMDREIWSTALICIHDKIGKAKTDSLVFSYYYHQSYETSMPQMAGVILKMDSLLFKGRNVVNIWQCFTDREILDKVPWNLIKTDPINLKEEVTLKNSGDFTKGISSANLQLLHPNQWNEIIVINNIGQEVATFTSQEQIELNPLMFSAGVFYIRVQSKDGQYNLSFKLLRL